MTITVDTNVVNEEGMSAIKEAIIGLDVQIAKTTVTSREQGTEFQEGDLVETGVWGESRWGRFKWGEQLRETFVLNESRLGEGLLGSETTASLYETLLKLISNGSFPPKGQRSDLTEPQRRQLRDVMILATHAREGRDIFVSNDMRAYGRPGSVLRDKLEGLCGTRIMTKEEFVSHCAELKSSELSS